MFVYVYMCMYLIDFNGISNWFGVFHALTLVN